MLLVLIVLVVSVPSTFTEPESSAAWFDASVSAAVMAVVCSLAFERRQRLFALLFGVPTLALSLGGWAIPLEAGTGPGLALASRAPAVLFLFGSAALTVKTLFVDRGRTFDDVLGSVCGYLFLGLGWAVLYVAIEDAAPDSFIPANADAGGPSAVEPQVLTYFSFVTLTTVGYGDVTPVSSSARTAAWLEAVAGQFYLAVIVAGLVANLSRSPREVRESDEKELD